MSHSHSPWLALTTLVVGATLAACGGSSSATPPAATITAATITAATAAPVSSLAATAAADRCPTAATVGGALGISLSKPTGVAGGGGTSLPAGATAVVCDYSGKALNVIIELIANIDPSNIALFSSKFPVPYASVSGVGDQARSFSQPLSAGKDNEGVVATKGSTLVSIVATATPASLAQIEALINQLL